MTAAVGFWVEAHGKVLDAEFTMEADGAVWKFALDPDSLVGATQITVSVAQDQPGEVLAPAAYGIEVNEPKGGWSEVSTYLDVPSTEQHLLVIPVPEIPPSSAVYVFVQAPHGPPGTGLRVLGNPVSNGPC